MPKPKTAKRFNNSLLTFAEVQNYLGIKSRKTVLKYVKDGKLPAYKMGGTRWRVALKDVKDFLNGGRAEVHRAPRKNSAVPETSVSGRVENGQKPTRPGVKS